MEAKREGKRQRKKKREEKRQQVDAVAGNKRAKSPRQGRGSPVGVAARPSVQRYAEPCGILPARTKQEVHEDAGYTVPLPARHRITHIYVAHWIAGQQRAMATHAFGTAGRSLCRNIDAASFLPSQQGLGNRDNRDNATPPWSSAVEPGTAVAKPGSGTGGGYVLGAYGQGERGKPVHALAMEQTMLGHGQASRRRSSANVGTKVVNSEAALGPQDSGLSNDQVLGQGHKLAATQQGDGKLPHRQNEQSGPVHRESAEQRQCGMVQQQGQQRRQQGQEEKKNEEKEDEETNTEQQQQQQQQQRGEEERINEAQQQHCRRQQQQEGETVAVEEKVAAAEQKRVGVAAVAAPAGAAAAAVVVDERQQSHPPPLAQQRQNQQQNQQRQQSTAEKASSQQQASSNQHSTDTNQKEAHKPDSGAGKESIAQDDATHFHQVLLSHPLPRTPLVQQPFAMDATSACPAGPMTQAELELAAAAHRLVAQMGPAPSMEDLFKILPNPFTVFKLRKPEMAPAEMGSPREATVRDLSVAP